MDIKPGEITDILKREIKEYDRRWPASWWSFRAASTG
jgi:hypothetical protein